MEIQDNTDREATTTIITFMDPEHDPEDTDEDDPGLNHDDEDDLSLNIENNDEVQE